jgi:hypothetical protein
MSMHGPIAGVDHFSAFYLSHDRTGIPPEFSGDLSECFTERQTTADFLTIAARQSMILSHSKQPPLIGKAYQSVALDY